MPDFLKLLIFARSIDRAMHVTQPLDAENGEKPLRIQTSFKMHGNTVNVVAQIAGNVDDIKSTLNDAVDARDVEDGRPSITDLAAVLLTASEERSATYLFKMKVDDKLTIAARIDAELVG